MTIIRLGPVVSDARGSTGGTTFSRNAAGAYMKQRVTPTYPGTVKQVAAAALLSLLVDRWKQTLTTVQRDSWNSLANVTTVPNKIGEQIKPSGFNLFMRSNNLLALTSQTLVDTAPADANHPGPTFALAHTPATGIVISSVGDWDITEIGAVLIYSEINLRQTVNYYKGPYTLVQQETIVLIGVVPYTLTATADLLINTRSHYRFRAVHEDGSVSFGVIGQADVGAVA